MAQNINDEPVDADQAKSRLEKLNEIARRCGTRSIISMMTEDEILGYDEFGVPSRHGTNFALTDVKRVR